ncbi:MAG: hypothetical protein A3I24_04450 [Candidatus Harrisonbacteria bacterium RIFCSPLOWO2_02_FULL_41_13b]|uniref:Uncharacterized protein n=1 Tax=Candidatus Harrisonbacteria bacterium RIFCSPLOWO2_02_FULL_41_13b TaxID=1798409 RepID=A0A1G1ZQC6_9BACT|nr:MAG: hypothetical protein A3J53_02680 [Candidatus Harrisonbacteria bacterium RIFCSPHIGHO2_02_FULL_40_20]OGY66742.1 MAG: hypothetical protein A3I24_04450 [Candidatus Harrisonbacteria bacterium RIFCSPLOWO2_02_FULL_41_13b]
MEKLPTEPSRENLELEINQLLERLDELGDLYSPELAEQWWAVEEEARCGKDRQKAKERLGDFIKLLESAKR